MPSKKSSHGGSDHKEGKGGVRPSSPLFKEGGDPIETVISIVEKKARNLSKRKDRLSTLAKEGKALDKDQQEAISKLPDVLVQIDFLHELQKQFSDLNLEYQRHLKSKLKSEEKRHKEEQRQIQKSSLRQCLRIQTILEQLDGATKEAFRSGSDGAIKLTEDEMKRIDDFYELVNPKRPGNPNFDNDVSSAAQHMVLLQEKSNEKVVGTTYKSLADLFAKVDKCGYLDEEEEEEEELPPEEDEEDEEEEENYEDETPSLNEFTTLKEVPPSNILDEDPSTTDATYQRNEILKEQIRQTTPTQQQLIGQTYSDMPSDEPTIRQSGNAPPISAPSPDFAGLGSNPMLPPSMEFQFMRGDPQPPPMSSQAPARFNSPTFPSTIEHNSPIERVPSNKERPVIDGQYVPETGQQMSNSKSDLVGNPVVGGGMNVGGGGDKMANEHQSNSGPQLSGNNSYKGANGHFMQQQQQSSSYDRRPQRNNGNGRPRPYGKQRRDGGGNYGGSYGGGGGNYGGNGNNGYGGSGGSSNRSGMGGGRQPPRNGGRGRPNYPYSRQPQNRSNNGPRNNTRPPQQQQSYGSTASAQS